MTPRAGRRAGAAAAALLLALFALEAWRGARDDAQTSDEAVTIASGYAFLRTREVRINPEHPMLAKSLIAAPLLLLGPEIDLESDAWRRGDQWVAAYEFLWENRVPGARLLLAARLPVVACGVALVALLALAARALYGPAAGLLALLLSYAARPSRPRHLALALALGLTLATRIAALQCLPALGAAALVRALVDPGLAARGSVGAPERIRRRPRLASAYVLLGGLTVAAGYALAVLALTYLGSPLPYLAGLERNALLAGYGHPTYLLGEVSNRGFPHYYLVALGVKLPVLTLALLGASVAASPALRLGRGKVELPLGAFALAFLVLASLGPAQTGVRYVLAVYPVLLLLASRLAAARLGRPALRLGLGAAIAGAYLGVLGAARPTYLSYFNELVGGPEGGIRVLADSNLDWGQDLARLGGWLKQRGNPPVRLAFFGNAPPEAHGIRYQALPAAGPVLPPPRTLISAGPPDLLCVSANNLLGLFFDRDLYAWLREREPLAVVGGSVWVYDLGGRRDDHLRIARVYRDLGWLRWAAHEQAIAIRGKGPSGAP